MATATVLFVIDFDQILKDAANGLFDIIVINDIDRFARDGNDIIRESDFLKKHFGIYVIDTKGFDTRKPRNTLVNFLKAGVAEDERLRIMERTIKARIRNARNGLRWSPKPPFGRAFKETGKQAGEWYLTKEGEEMETILEAYVNDDKSFRELAREHGILSAQRITRLVREAQLAARPYKAVFNSPEIEIVNLVVEIPAVPPVISQNLLERVLAKMALNQKTKRQKNRNYLLSGMVQCSHCGMFLKGQSQRGRSYYTHNNFYADRKPCPYNGIRLDILETHVMDYLTEFFFNKPAFDRAIKAALPTNDDRDAIVQDIQSNKKAVNKANSKISNFCNAIGEGKKISSLLVALESAEAEKQALEKRAVELQETLVSMPDPEIIKAQSEFIRGKMLVECLTKDWQDMPYKDLRRFLHLLFSENPRQNNYGISLGKQNEKWYIDFNGCFDFNHLINDGQAELKDSLTDKDKAKIANKMKAKNNVISTFRELEDVSSKTERLKNLIDEAKKAEKALKGSSLFSGTDYL